MQINNKNLCPNCFSEMTGEPCPQCGYTQGSENLSPYALPAGTVLLGKYIVGKMLGKGGFGITYLAYEIAGDRKVAIKEYYPDGIAFRSNTSTGVSTYMGEKDDTYKSGAEKFYEEARTVSRFNGNPNIIHVYEFFYENNTAYFVMEYVEGVDLKKHLSSQGGKIEMHELMGIITPVLDALTIIHSVGVLHRDISPDNIYLSNDGRVILLDFGAARQIIGEESKSLSVILKQGFAPIEQYQKKGKQGPWSDIYALGATMYYALTGAVPEDVMSRVYQDELKRPSELGVRINSRLENIIIKMLAVRSEHRYQSAIELKADVVQATAASSTYPQCAQSNTQPQYQPYIVPTQPVNNSQQQYSQYPPSQVPPNQQQSPYPPSQVPLNQQQSQYPPQQPQPGQSNISTQMGNTPNQAGYVPQNQTNYTPVPFSPADEAGYIGNNVWYYQQKFAKMRQSNSKASWNWAAFLFAPYWLVYRKTMIPFLLYFFLYIAQLGLSLIALDSGDTEIALAVTILFNLFSLGFSIVIGISGNNLYMKRIEKSIKILQIMPMERKPLHIKKTRGTAVGPVIFIIVFFIGLGIMSTLVSANLIDSSYAGTYGTYGMYDSSVGGTTSSQFGTQTNSSVYTAASNPASTLKNGFYKETYSNGYYEGNFVNGEKTGYGEFYFDNGDIYKGAFLNSEKNGYGEYYYSDGTSYKGDWKDDARTGNGTETFSNGYYKGAFIDGERTGQGEFTFDDGDYYKGAFVDGERTGYGEYYFNDGDIYKGNFLKGKKNGYGEYYFSEGGSYKGQWINDEKAN